MLKRFKNKISNQHAFTITEVVVSVAIFATVVTIMLVLFNYTLRLNRRTEALRQTTQGMRNFVEFLIKEVRNGMVDYSTDGVSSPSTPVLPCPAPVVSGPTVGNTYAQTSGTHGYITYGADNSDTRLGVVNLNGERECFFWGKVVNNRVNPVKDVDYYVNPANNSDGNPTNDLDSIILVKQNITGVGSLQVLNPQNFRVTYLRFYIRPLHDPYLPLPSPSSYPQHQPLVTIVARFQVTLPTGEQVTIPYQTTVSSDDYGVPR